MAVEDSSLTGSAGGAICFFTNLFFFQTLSLAQRAPADNHLGAHPCTQ